MNTCSRELVPEGETAVRSLTIAADGSLVVAANNKGSCFVWQLGENDTSVRSIILLVIFWSIDC